MRKLSFTIKTTKKSSPCQSVISKSLIVVVASNMTIDKILNKPHSHNVRKYTFNFICFTRFFFIFHVFLTLIYYFCFNKYIHFFAISTVDYLVLLVQIYLFKTSIIFNSFLWELNRRTLLHPKYIFKSHKTFICSCFLYIRDSVYNIFYTRRFSSSC